MPKYAYPLTLKRFSGAEYLSSSEQHGLKYMVLYFSRDTLMQSIAHQFESRKIYTTTQYAGFQTGTKRL